MARPGRIVVALTGASGTRYGRRLLHVLSHEAVALDLIVSDSARQVLEAEEDILLGPEGSPAALVADLGPLGPATLRVHRPGDLGAEVASGSARVDAMVVLPCSLATVGAVASGAGRTLVHRVADVMLKEHRRLVLCPRETPLSAIHLENLLRLAQAGARIVPCMPAFTARPETVDDLVDQLVMRVCDQLDLHLDLVPRWQGPPERPSGAGEPG